MAAHFYQFPFLTNNKLITDYFSNDKNVFLSLFRAPHVCFSSERVRVCLGLYFFASSLCFAYLMGKLILRMRAYNLTLFEVRGGRVHWKSFFQSGAGVEMGRMFEMPERAHKKCVSVRSTLPYLLHKLRTLAFHLQILSEKFWNRIYKWSIRPFQLLLTSILLHFAMK